MSLLIQRETPPQRLQLYQGSFNDRQRQIVNHSFLSGFFFMSVTCNIVPDTAAAIVIIGLKYLWCHLGHFWCGFSL